MLIFVSGFPPDGRGEKLYFVKEKNVTLNQFTQYIIQLQTHRRLEHVYICSDSNMFRCTSKIFIYPKYKSTTNLRPLVPSHCSKCTCIAVRTYTFFIRVAHECILFFMVLSFTCQVPNISPFTFRFIAFTHSGMHVCISSCSFTAHLIITFPVCISYLLEDNNDGK